MEKNRTCAPTRQSRPDRSRSPHCINRLLENAEKPKSVLYPADVQYFRDRSRKSVRRKRLHCKQSSSNSFIEYQARTSAKQSENTQTRMDSPYNATHNVSVQRTAERLQKWTRMYSPSKFMAGLLPKGKKCESTTVDRDIPKNRMHRPWTIEYFLNEPLSAQKETIDGCERESSNKYSSQIRAKEVDIINEAVLASALKGGSNCAKNDCEDNNSRILLETNSNDAAANRPVTPLKYTGLRTAPELELSSFVTPKASTTPNDSYFTPLTHVRLPDNVNSDVNKLPSTFGRHKFSLVNEDVSRIYSPTQRITSLKDITTSQLDALDRISSKLDIAKRNALEVLSKPIRLDLPSSSNMPNFSDKRQTIDFDFLWKGKHEAENSPSCHSLPGNTSFCRRSLSDVLDLSLNNNINGAQSNQSNNKTTPNVPENLEQQIGDMEISFPKALGLSMTAELAFADRIEQSKKQLDAICHLADTVRGKMTNLKGDNRGKSHETFNSKSFYDESWMAFDHKKSPDVSRFLGQHMVQSVHKENGVTTSANHFEMAEKEERKDEVNSYIRMRRHLYNLQLVVLKLKKRGTSTTKQVTKIETLIRAAKEDYEKAIDRANSWLKAPIPQNEFLTFIKIRQQRLYNASEECLSTIKKLLSDKSLKMQRDAKNSYSSHNEKSSQNSGKSAIRIDTRALNESVECDIWNLSARSMRRNLEVRREQAEFLNKSFQDISKNIEKRTKESIAAQIVQYDRVIAERKDLLHQLDKIPIEDSKEEPLISPRVTTPRVKGVEPLDLTPLSHAITIIDNRTKTPGEVASIEDISRQVSVSQVNSVDNVCRSESQSTVYEDSFSHLGEDDANSYTAPFGKNLQQEMPSTIENDVLPSRRTLDTAEILTMLSRSAVTLITETAKDDVKQDVVKLAEEADEAVHLDDVTKGVLLIAEEAKEEVTNIQSDNVANMQTKGFIASQDNREDADSAKKLEFDRSCEGNMAVSDVEDYSDDMLYTKKNVSLYVSLSQFHQDEMEASKNILERVSKQMAIEDCITLKKSESSVISARSDSPSVAPIPSLDHNSEPLLDMPNESDEARSIQNSEDGVAIQRGDVKETQIVYKGGEDTVNIDEQLEVEQGNIVTDSLTVFEEIQDSKSETTTDDPIVSELASGDDHDEQLSAISNGRLSFEEEELITEDSDVVKHVQNEPNCTAMDYTSMSMEKNAELLKSDGGIELTVFQELPREAEQNALIDLRCSDEMLPVSDSSVNGFGIERSQLNDDVPADVLHDGKKYDNDQVILNDGKISELKDSTVLDHTIDGFSRLSLNRSELCDSLSSSIMQLMEAASPQRRRSLSISTNRYELNDSLLDDSTSSMPKSPRMHQDRYITRMPNSLSPRSRLPHDGSLIENIPHVIVEEVVRSMADAVISDVDKEIAQLQLRRPLLLKKNDVSIESTSALDESYEDLFAIEKPPSLFEKYPCTSETHSSTTVYVDDDTSEKLHCNELPSKLDAVSNRSVDYNKEVNSPEWMKRKCSCYSMEVWRLINSNGFVRPLFDEFISPPVLEDDLRALTESEQLIVKNKSILIWSTVVELAVRLWPESSDNRHNISSKWWPIPSCEAEFAKMAERYMFEQFNDLPLSHRYKRLSRPWACDDSETYIDEVVARYLYSDVANYLNFTRKVKNEYCKICEELVEMVGDRFVSTEAQQVQNLCASHNDGSEAFDRTHESFRDVSGENGRPSITRFSNDSMRSTERSPSIGTSVTPLRIFPEE